MSAQGYFDDSDHEFINQRIVLLCPKQELNKFSGALSFRALQNRAYNFFLDWCLTKDQVYFLKSKSTETATPKIWIQALDPNPKKPGPRKTGLRKTWTLKKLDPEKPDPEKSGPWKFLTMKNKGNNWMQNKRLEDHMI